MPASLPGDDAPLRRVRNRRTPAADGFEATPESGAAPLSAEARTEPESTLPANRSERRARRIVSVSSDTRGVADAPVSGPDEQQVTLGRRARRSLAAADSVPDNIVSDWMGTRTEHDLEKTVVLSRRARRARQVVSLESSALDETEALPLVSRRARRSARSESAEDIPLLTFEPRATLESAPVAATPSDLVVAAESTDSSESFTIVQDDPADVASHNAIVDEREAVAVMIEDVPVEPVIASVSPTIVLDSEDTRSAAPILDVATLHVEHIDMETTTSVVAVGHLTEQDERPVFVPRTELIAPVAAAASVSAAPAPAPAVSRRHRAGRVAAKSFSFAAFSVAGLLTLATSLPANALLSADDVAAQKVLVTQGDSTSTSTGQTQTVAASGATAMETVKRDSYGAMSAIEAAKALGIQPEATFSNDPNGTVQWPFAVGVHIGSGYGARPGCPIGCSTNHKGQDFNPGYGAPIQSIADGIVIESTDSGGAFGVKIVIEHVIDGQVVRSLYGHMINGSRTVQVGDPVTVGQVIGQTGNTGRSTGPHLHFEILLGGTEHVDPLDWLYANTN
ncbi:M23 family metallopeptidase [Labedella populi]|uniref:M23 family metallopeptidase n=1 Tax=Labedella populi TaxID=2498850 RepID=A0A444Q6V5_9MICO|nr:M23 family metallopeptidase [Labedella populi]RWZ59639.1 M23 family metallopeptidase [Labedella populi]